MKMFKTLREENENIMKLKEQTKEKLRVGLISEGKEAIQQELNRTDVFENAKVMDMRNEGIPDIAGNTKGTMGNTLGEPGASNPSSGGKQQ